MMTDDAQRQRVQQELDKLPQYVEASRRINPMPVNHGKWITRDTAERCVTRLVAEIAEKDALLLEHDNTLIALAKHNSAVGARAEAAEAECARLRAEIQKLPRKLKKLIPYDVCLPDHAKNHAGVCDSACALTWLRHEVAALSSAGEAPT